MRVVIEVPRARGQLRVIRRFVEAWAASESRHPGSLPLVVTELVTNALNASPEDASVILRLERDGDELRVVVADEGPGFTLGTPTLPPIDAPGGRGLALVSGWVDSLTVERIDGLTVVTATIGPEADQMASSADRS